MIDRRGRKAGINPSDLKRLQGGTMPLVPAEESASGAGAGAASSASPANRAARDGPPPDG
ncbi:hypothetical protein OG698_04500 [Streptomyces sp. NBC_01003]|uniref:hypothetical protein n=1 Tax=Streptomyces sp. NBC_01003 TaxID=2903714 RepID=UPI00386F5D99|nr:hypothetical protein OG698_04500 [Streptomyces sp. NBC_01003]